MANKSPQLRSTPKAPQSPNPSVIAQHQQWSGPLPPPAALNQFNTIIPNGAERIMAMVETEQKHRITSEGRILTASIADNVRGVWIGFVLAGLAIGGAIFTAYLDTHPAVSIALVSLPLVLLIQAFVGKKSKD